VESILAHKNVLITGGTSVLGSAFVRKALAAGAHVFFTFYRNVGRAQELEKLGARSFQLDLAEGAAIDRFQKKFRSEIKILHVLIHNAATTRDSTIQNMTEAEWDETLHVNLKAPYLLTQKLLPLLFKAKRSKIFFMVSRAALQGIFGAANYAASKAGLVGLAKSLAQELAHPHSLATALSWAMWVHQFRGEVHTVQERAEAVMALSAALQAGLAYLLFWRWLESKP